MKRKHKHLAVTANPSARHLPRRQSTTSNGITARAKPREQRAQAHSKAQALAYGKVQVLVYGEARAVAYGKVQVLAYGKWQARDICRDAIAWGRRFSGKACAPMVVNRKAGAAGGKPAAT